MNKTMLRKCLLKYKPLDARLRRFDPYLKFSRLLQNRYNKMMRGSSPEARTANQEDLRTYIENIDSTPLKSNTILFECYWGKKFAGNPLAMYRALVESHPQKGHFRIFWSTAKGVTPPAEIANNPDVTLVRIGTPAYAMALLEATYLVNNVTFPTWFIRRTGQRYCNTWHGIPMKAMGRDMAAPLVSMANSQRNFLQSNLLLEMNDFYHDAAIKPYFLDQLAAGSLFACGAPRVDDVLSPKISSQDLREKFGISNDQKVVLFAPTWRGNSTSISSVFGDQAQLWAQLAHDLGEDYFVLFSAHQMVKVGKANTVSNGALIPDDANINDILTIVDIMVSDYSSIIFDFLPANRAIVLFTPDIEQYRKERGLYLEPADLPCVDTKTVPELLTAIRSGKLPSETAGWLETQNRFAPLENGSAAKDAITELLSETPASSHRKSDGRIRILIGPGGLIPNGVTTSLKNLISNIDYELFDPYILLEAAVIDKDALRREQLEQIDPRCNWIIRTGGMLLTYEESPIYQRFRKGDVELSESDLEIIRRIFERENRRLLGEAQFDLAIEFSGYSPYWTTLIACSNSKRKVCYQHNHLWAEYTNPDPSRNQTQLSSVFRTYSWFDQIVAVSDETRDVNEKHLSEFYPKNMEALTVRNTMNFERVKQKARLPVVLSHPQAASIFQEPDLFRFIALGRLSPEKRYDRMIGALAKIAPDHPNVVLLICGSGPLQAQLTELAKKLDVLDQVRFLGQVSNPYPLLARADACIMTSDYEGQPMALLEAICLGTPCIGSDIPGIRAVLKDGCGHIVAPTEDAFADVMRSAIENRLPTLAPHAIGDEYVNITMGEFRRAVCGLPG